MSETRSIPEDLATIPPGPVLAAVLASIDLSSLRGKDCVTVSKAWYRLKSFVDAGFLDSIAETAVRTDSDTTERDPAPGMFSADEARLALAWTRRTAEARTEFAWDLRSRLPQVLAALAAGAIDEPKARVFSEWTFDLTDEQARAIADGLLPGATGWTTGQLVEKIKKWAIALDPQWAERRYTRAVQDRRVVAYPNPDGSATLAGHNLPADRVPTARGRLTGLARRAKAAGHPATVDQVRADLYLGLADGTYTGLSEDEVVAALLAETAAGAESGHSQPGHGHNGGVGSPARPEPAQGCDPAGAAAHSEEATAPEAPDAPRALGTAPLAPALSGRPRRGRGVELRVAVSTLAGLDHKPGEIPGWAPVHAELARELAAAHAGGQWCFALHDHTGRLVLAGITRHRPAGAIRKPSGAVVELHLGLSQLTAWSATGAPPGWERVIADVAGQYAAARRPGRGRRADPRRRFADAALRRHIQIRDRTCSLPGCRAPARHTDLDHAHDYAKGGLTTAANLGPACRHDHRLKDHGWTLAQPEPGRFSWRSRLGHTYHNPGAIISEPLPEPLAPQAPQAPQAQGARHREAAVDAQRNRPPPVAEDTSEAGGAPPF